MRTRRPRCQSRSPEGYRCRKSVHAPGTVHTATGWQGTHEWDDETAATPRWQVVTIGAERHGWSVDRLIAAAAGRPAHPIRPADWDDPDAVDARWAAGTDIHTPVILIPHPDTGRPTLIDGRHRVHKAHRLGRPHILAVRLTAADEHAARLTPDEWARTREPDPFG